MTFSSAATSAREFLILLQRLYHERQIIMNTYNGLKGSIVCILLILSTGSVSVAGIALLGRSSDESVVLMLEFDSERPSPLPDDTVTWSTGSVSVGGIALLGRSCEESVVLMLKIDPDDTEVTIATDDFGSSDMAFVSSIYLIKIMLHRPFFFLKMAMSLPRS
jgi:hypothetical protein